MSGLPKQCSSCGGFGCGSSCTYVAVDSKFITKLRENDPVYSCDVYKNHGCSHVDGMLCDMETCNNLKDFKQNFRVEI